MTNATSKLVGLEELQPEACDGTGTDAMSKRFHKWHLDVPLEEVILDPTQPVDLAALVPVPCSECPNDPITKRMLSKWKLCDSSASKTATAVQDVEEPLPTVLLVAEKRQMAIDIAEKLSPQGGYRTLVRPPAKKGDRTLEVFTFEGPFSAGHVQRAHFKVVATHGHLYHSDFTDQDVRIGSSATFESADLAFDGEIGKYVPPEKRTSPATKNRRDQSKMDNRATNSAVHDDYIKVPQGYNINDRTFRAIYSTVNDIKKAMDDLQKPNRKYADAVEAKKIIDLRCVGIGRFITAHIREALGDEYIVDFLHYGPCIAPILALIVRRFKEDRAAQKVARKYWRVTWTVERSGHTLEVSSDFDQQPNKHVLAKLVDTTCCVSVEESKQSREPPKALDTVAMMAEASEQLKMQPKDAMKAAQALYEGKLITYPRTDTNVFPRNFDFGKTAEASIASCLKDIMQSQDGVRSRLTRCGGGHPTVRGECGEALLVRTCCLRQVRPPIRTPAYRTDLQHAQGFPK
ncbi:DNA topoisomerase family protein [Aphelenchoides avenae]|nr:DNA topoisomerase family protein [Aphelenchus avenae]